MVASFHFERNHRWSGSFIFISVRVEQLNTPKLMSDHNSITAVYLLNMPMLLAPCTIHFPHYFFLQYFLLYLFCFSSAFLFGMLEHTLVFWIAAGALEALFLLRSTWLLYTRDFCWDCEPVVSVMSALFYCAMFLIVLIISFLSLHPEFILSPAWVANKRLVFLCPSVRKSKG